jgi:uncharacterized protein YbaP (TraB family)
LKHKLDRYIPKPEAGCNLRSGALLRYSLHRCWSVLLLALTSLLFFFGSVSQAQTAACPPSLQVPTADQVVQARQATRNRGFLWKISKDQRISYLYGTIHLGRLEWIFPGPNLIAALSASDLLALEVDPLDEKIQAELVSVQQQKNQLTLPPKLRQRLDTQIAAACTPAQAVKHLSPIMQVVVVSMLRGRFQGLEPAYGQELALSTIARQSGMPVISLESAEIQVRALVPDNPQESLPMLDSLLTQLESAKTDRYYLRISEIWNNSNMADLENFQSWCECAESEADRRLLRRMNDDRNRAMADRIEALHRQGKRVMAAAGALHMTGNQALPKLMQERGFTVERIH